MNTWCSICDNWEDRKCNLVAAANTATVSHGHTVSAMGAGFIGAGVTIAVALAALAMLAFLGLLAFGRKKKASRGPILPVLEHKASHVSVFRYACLLSRFWFFLR